MNKLKFYVNDEKELNKYEKESEKISYKRLVDYLFDSIILCNNIADELNFDEIEVGNIYDEEYNCYDDIYQYFIVDFPDFILDFMKKYCNNEIILFYHEKLDIYILGVTHYGTSWDYVLTDFGYTTDYENSMQGQLYN